MSVITSKGQITLPASVRHNAGFHPGENVDVLEDDGQIVVTLEKDVVKDVIRAFSTLGDGRASLSVEQIREITAQGWIRDGLDLE